MMHHFINFGLLLIFPTLFAGKLAAADGKNWVPPKGFPSAKLVAGKESGEAFLISQDPAHPWKLGDRVCVSRNNNEIGCGIVIEALATQARVRLTTKMVGVVSVKHPKKKRRKLAAKGPPLVAPSPSAVVSPAPAEPSPPAKARAELAPAQAKPLDEALLVPNVPPSPKPEPPVAPPADATPAPVHENGAAADTSPSGAPFLGFQLAVGLGTLSYTETGHGNASTTTLRPSMEVDANRTGTLSVSAYAFVDAIDLTNNRSESTRLLGAGASTRLRLVSGSVAEAGLGLGFRYRSLLVQDNAFGLRDLAAPEVRADTVLSLTAQSRLGLIFYYAPILQGLTGQGRNREWGGEIDWYPQWNKASQLVLGLELSSLDFSSGSIDGQWVSGLFRVGWSW